ncbi:MAG: hypothetical protein DRO15_03815 [Thermoprotei archaeon]|nr:MAG: hypothetical protein DRO15_03815 [Thermoprotei archaeon]
MSFFERMWPIRKKLWWCPTCNVPLVKTRCNRCNTEGISLKLTAPGDARPGLERDEKALLEAYVNEFGTKSGFTDFRGSSILLLNKVPYIDEMREVVSDGIVICRIYFDPYIRKWRLRLSKPGVLRILNRGIVNTFEVESQKFLRRLFRIKTSRVFRKYEQIVLTHKGEPVGIGYYENGYIKVHSIYPRTVADRISRTNSSINDIIRANENSMREFISKALAFIDVTLEKTAIKPIVSFSGGKDSLVVLHLVLQLGIEPTLLFNNTGIELPETIESVHRTARKYGLNLVVADAGNAFWNSVEFFGPPGRDYRWCCKILKLAPLSRTIKSTWNDDILNIVGQRAFESLDRARRPRIWRSQWVPRVLCTAPIHTWSQLEVWIYIFMNKLTPNPLYEMGYERIGCFMCPASTLAELELVKNTHPHLWGNWTKILNKWSEKLGVNKEVWIEYGLWRWLAPARHKQVISRKLGSPEITNEWRSTYELWIENIIDHIDSREEYIHVTFKNEIPHNAVEAQLPILGIKEVKRNSKGVLSIKLDHNAEAEIRGKDLILMFKTESDFENCMDLLKLLIRWIACQQCKNCELSCLVGAISVKNKPVVNSSNCIHCRLCLRVCPVAEVYVEHLVIPLIINTPLAWRRPCREGFEEVLSKITTLLSISKKVEERTAEMFRNRLRKVEDNFAAFFSLMNK